MAFNYQKGQKIKSPTGPYFLTITDVKDLGDGFKAIYVNENGLGFQRGGTELPRIMAPGGGFLGGDARVTTDDITKANAHAGDINRVFQQAKFNLTDKNQPQLIEQYQTQYNATSSYKPELLTGIDEGALSKALDMQNSSSNAEAKQGVDEVRRILGSAQSTTQSVAQPTPEQKPTISTSFPTQNLTPGTSGESVKQLQDYLVSRGLMTRDQVDTGYGTYGPQTTAAVKKLQEELGVDNTTGPGYWGPRTIAKIQGSQPAQSTQSMLDQTTPSQPREGDTRVNPQTGQKEFYNPEGIWTPETIKGQGYEPEVSQKEPLDQDIGYTFGKQLDFGTKGEDVKKLQQFLNRTGFSVAEAGKPGSVGFETDFFGPATQAALKKFQASQGIETKGDPTTTGFGRVGPKTLTKLNELYGSSPEEIVSSGIKSATAGGDGLLGGAKEGDYRANPTTGKQEFLNPEGQWIPVTDPGQTVGGTNLDAGTSTIPGIGGGTPGAGSPGGGASAATPGVGGGATGQPDPGKAARDAAAAAANQVAEGIFNSIKDQDIDVRESSKLLEGLKTKVEDEKAPVQPNLNQIFSDEKKKLGLDLTETQISEIDSRIEAINTNLFVESEKAGERLVGAREISRRKGTLQKAAEREIALLQIEKNALSRQAANKLDTIKLTMDIAKTDFQITSDKYNNDYKKAVDMYNLVAGAEDRDLSAAGRIKDDARANLTVLQNVVKSGNLEYDKLTADQKQKIKQLELQAGYPAGITESITRVIGKAEVLFTEKSYDENGREIVTVAYKDPTTGKFSSKEVIQTGGAKPKELFTDNVHRALAAAGLSEDQINHIEDGIVNFGLDEVIESENLTPEQEEALRGGLTGSKDSKLITASAIQTTSVNAKQEDVENTLRGTYTDAELSDLADEAGFSAWFDLAPEEIRKYLQSPAARKKYAEILRGQYESAGYKITD